MTVVILVATSAAAALFGAASSYTSRIVVLERCNASCSADPAYIFSKPIYITFIAFVACSVSLAVPLLQRCGVLSCGPSHAATSRNRHASFDSQDTFHSASIDSLRPCGSQIPLKHLEDDDEITVRVRDLALGGLKAGTSSRAPNPALGSSALREAHAARAWLRHYSTLLLPTILELISTLCMIAAGMFIAASVNSALRGFLLLCTAASASLVGSKEKSASKWEWASMWVSTLGAGLVGFSSLLDGADLGTIQTAALGISLSLFANVAQGFQYAFETLYLEQGKYTPYEANGVEGIIGTALCVVLLAFLQVLPIGWGSDNGRLEDTAATLCCLRHSPRLVELSVAIFGQWVISTSAYMSLSALRGGNHRALMMVMRALLVWFAELISFYVVFPGCDGSGSGADCSTASHYGQAWSKNSWIAALGFAVLVLGGYLGYIAQTAREVEHQALGSPRGEEEDGLEEDAPDTPLMVSSMMSKEKHAFSSWQGGRSSRATIELVPLNLEGRLAHGLTT